MGFNVSGSNPKLNEYAIWNSLDIKDGKEDKRINASIWNAFADVAGGKHIRNFIEEGNAIKSIKYYLKKATPEVLDKICKFLGWGETNSAVQEKAQKNYDDAETLMNKMKDNKENLEIVDTEAPKEGSWEDSNGYTKSKMATLSDGQWIAIYYNSQGEIGRIQISTQSTDTEKSRNVNYSEIDFYRDGRMFIDADENANNKYDVKLTGQNSEFEKYEALAKEIFGDLSAE